MNYLFLINYFHNSLIKLKKKKYHRNLIAKGLKIGKNVKIIEDVFLDPSHCFLIKIGDNSIIAPNVRLIAHDASTKIHLGYTKIGKIEIGNNCFIGDSTIILPNVKVGDNSIIGAGSVVTKDIPADVIAAGNPAKVIIDIKSYLGKIRSISRKKRIFTKEYYIENLDKKMRTEIINSIEDSIGFIV